MKSIPVWDPFVRLFHWALVALFFAEFFLFDHESSLHERAGYVVLTLIAARLI